MRTRLTLILLLLCTGYAYAQKSNTADSATIDGWLDKARSLLNSDIPAAENLAHQALAAATSINYVKGIGKAYMRLGVAMTNEGKNDSALYYFKNALGIRQRIADKKGTAGTLREISYVFRAISETDSAFSYCFQALRLNEAEANKPEIGMNYQDIGTLYLNYGNEKEAKNYFDKAVAILKDAGDSVYLGSAYNKLGNFYYSKSDYPSALQNYFKALGIDEQKGNSISAAQNIANIAACYFYQKKYNQAKEYYHKALAFDIENEIQSELPGIYNALGYLFRDIHQPDSAIYFLQKSIVLTEETKDKEQQALAYETLTNVYQAQGNYKSALETHQKYVSINDSLLSNTKMKQIVEMQTKYETERKDNQITVLNKDNDLKEAENRRQRLKFIFSLIALSVGIFFLVLVFYQKNKIAKEKKRSDLLLLNILPAETAEELKNTGTTKAKDFSEVTVLFTDFKNFTSISERLTAQQIVNEINFCYSAFDNIMTKYGIEKIKTIGDSYMCAGGLPVANTTNAMDTVRAAIDIRDFILLENQKRMADGKPFFEIRIGCHTGPVVAGIVGLKKFAYDIWGDTVNIASRMESSGEPGKINISGTTYELIKDKFNCTYRGKIEAKNKGEVQMYFVENEL